MTANSLVRQQSSLKKCARTYFIGCGFSGVVVQSRLHVEDTDGLQGLFLTFRFSEQTHDSDGLHLLFFDRKLIK